MGWVRDIIFFALFLALSKPSEAEVFDRSHVGAFFEPHFYIQNAAGPNLVNELVSPLSKISAEFSKISLHFNDWGLPKVSFVPAAIASFNKDYLKANESHLEVTIFIMKDDTEEEFTNPTTIALQIAAKASDEANKIYPGTVTRIFLQHIRYIEEKKDMQVHKFEAYLANAAIQKTAIIYELGASIPLEFCKDDGLPQVLKHIQHISFSWWPDGLPDYLELNANSTVEALSKQFNECQKTIREYGNNITIQIEAGWSLSQIRNQMFDPKPNHRGYWENLNNLAIETNTTVVFVGIFENIAGSGRLITAWGYEGRSELDEIPVKIANHSENYDVTENENMTVNGNNYQSPESWGSRLAIFIICVFFGVAFTVIFIKCDKYATIGVQPKCW